MWMWRAWISTALAGAFVVASLAWGDILLGADELRVDPAQVRLVGSGARWTLLVDRVGPAGRATDHSSQATFTSVNPAICTVTPSGEVIAVADGSTQVRIETPAGRATVAVSVTGTRETPAFNFENDITPLLTRFACNYSGCHGKAEGQNGFKLSVFGFDAQADYDALLKETRGRRVHLAAPERSLLLLKAAGLSPHGGGVRIPPGTREYALIRDWIAAGAPFGQEDDPKVVQIRLTPRERVLDPLASQRLRVVARYSDGREVDVTSLSKFQSNHDGIATVDESGLVSVADLPGQVAIMASFSGQFDVFTALIPRAEGLDRSAEFVEFNAIDRHVNDKLRRLNVAPSPTCDDATFVRRVTLDLIGRLPTADEARTFLTDRRADKRAQWVDALLERSEFADYWALKWADLLRVDRQALGHKLAHDYYQWIRDSWASNKPFDQFTRELLTAEGPLSESPQGAFYKVQTKPGEVASALAQVFLGVRIACAECHHHPHDRWSQDDYYGMTAFFAQVNRKTTPRGEAIASLGEPKTMHPRTGVEVVAHPLGTTAPETLPPGDRRPRLAEWLTASDNPWFARTVANRLWGHLLGRGIVEPVDDVRATNPPSNPELLDGLAQYLVEQRYDLRALIRYITASAAYQRSSTPNGTNERDEQNYSRALFKRLDAEVLLDAVCDTTGVEEKFQGVPSGSRAVQLWDSRVGHYFLRLFGRPTRTTACACERVVEPNVSQVLHMLNSPELHAKLDHRGGQIHRWGAANFEPAELADTMYLTFYSRFPSPEERQVAIDFLSRAGADRRQAVQDLAWSLMNTLEFVFNH